MEEKNARVKPSRKKVTVEKLFAAIKSDEEDRFFELLDENDDVRGEWLDRRNDEQQSLLFCASQRGLHRVVAKLVALEVNIESRDCFNVTPLHIAARFGHFR